MTCDIFIRSYEKDFEWLKYCLRSIQRFATGFRNVIVVVPNGQTPPVGPVEKVFFVHEGCDGYMHQQLTKLHADCFSDAEVFLFMDSDTIFTRPITAGAAFEPWLYTPYASLNDPNTMTWMKVVQKAIGVLPEYEFMRRHPLSVQRWMLQGLREFFWQRHGMSLESYIIAQPGHEFSEWNVIGAWLWYFHRSKVQWQNTDEKLGVPFVHQSYSWGGLNDDIRKNLEAALA